MDNGATAATGIIALLALLVCAVAVPALELGGRPRRRPGLTLACCALLAACLAAQCVAPSLLGRFERNAAQIFAGQWWRLVTALFFQDGGWVGGLTNIAALWFIGNLAEQRFRRAIWAAVYGLGGLAAECIALSWQPVGAGNSIAVCALAGAMVVVPHPAGAARLPMVLRAGAVGAALLLLARRDIHGAGFFIGAALGLMLIGRRWAHARTPSD